MNTTTLQLALSRRKQSNYSHTQSQQKYYSEPLHELHLVIVRNLLYLVR